MLKTRTILPIRAAVLCGALFGFMLTAQAQVGTQHIQFTGVTSLVKGKVKDVHAFDDAAQASITETGVELRIPDTGTVLTFDFETEWRRESDRSYSIGMVDPTGWQWIATYHTLDGTLTLTDGSKWAYAYTTATQTQLAEKR